MNIHRVLADIATVALPSLILILHAGTIVAYSQTIENSQYSPEVMVLDADFHRPKYIQTGNANSVQITQSAMTHPGITYPKWIEQFPVQEKLFVIFNDELVHRVSIDRELDLPFLKNYWMKNSNSLIGRFQKQTDTNDWLLGAAKWRLEQNESFFLENLSEQEIQRIDRLLFWKLIRQDGIICTLAANRYIIPILAKLEIERTPNQIDKIRALGDACNLELQKTEMSLLGEYADMILHYVGKDHALELGSHEVSAMSLVLHNLDVLSHDTRKFLNGDQNEPIRINRRYVYTGLGGLRLRPAKRVWLDPEIEVEIEFINQLATNPKYRTLFSKEAFREILELNRELIRQLSEIDANYALVVGQRNDFDVVLRNSQFLLTVKNAINDIAAVVDEKCEKEIRTLLEDVKIRTLGISYVATKLTETDLKLAKRDFELWLTKVDREFSEAEQRIINDFLQLLSPAEADLLKQLLGSRPPWLVDGFSQMRINVRFKF